jgi:hypothetical protein
MGDHPAELDRNERKRAAMHALLIVPLICGSPGIVGALAGFGLPPCRFAQPICEVLSRGWRGLEAACCNERGGNGDEDPTS